MSGYSLRCTAGRDKWVYEPGVLAVPWDWSDGLAGNGTRPWGTASPMSATSTWQRHLPWCAFQSDDAGVAVAELGVYGQLGGPRRCGPDLAD